MAEPGLEPGCSNFKFRGLAAMAVVFKLCTQQSILGQEGDPGIPSPHSDGSSSNFLCFICWCSIQDFVCKKGV